MECIGKRRARRAARAAMFDFDGTVALVRAGWMPLMLEYMMERLRPLTDDEAGAYERAQDYVARLTGRDTVYQMEAFAEHVRALGGEALSGAEYKADFLRSIDAAAEERLDAVREGRRPAGDILVPGTVELLRGLRGRGVRVYLASGTAHEVICAECGVLGIAGMFDGIFGSAPGVMNKPEVLRWFVASGIAPEEILTFGDGRVEIEAAREVGSVAVGVATDEEGGCMAVDPLKRGWLIEAGAEYILPNFLGPDAMRLAEGVV